MPRKCLLFGLLLLVLGTVFGMVLQSWTTDAPKGPPTASTPQASGDTSAADGTFRRGVPAPDNGTPTADETGDAAVRVPLGTDTPQVAPHALEVHVTARGELGERTPVPFVDVVLEADADPATRCFARCDARGRARFVFVDAATHRIVVTSGAGGSVATELTLTDQTLELSFATRAVAAGKVIDHGGRGIADADLVLLRWTDANGDGALQRIGRSGADGSFRVPVAIGGRLGAIAARHAPSALHLLRAAAGATPPLQQSYELVLFGAAATVRGTVVDGDGRPVPGARIGIDSLEPRPAGTERSAPLQFFTADREGEFVAKGLTPGLLAIDVTADELGWHRQELRVAASGEAFVTVRLPWPSRVVGVVETVDGTPVPGARVTAGPPDSWTVVATRSDAAGNFVLPGLGSGAVRLRAVHDGVGAQAELDLVEGESHEWRAVLGSGAPAAVLRGVVIGADERPRADWRIVVRAEGASPRAARTADDGTFQVTVPRRNGLDVRAFASGRELTGFADALVRGVDCDNGVLRIVLEPTPPATLRAVVTSETGEALAATIGAWHHERREYARFAADPDGRVTIRHVPAGTIDLTFEHPGYARRELLDHLVPAGGDELLPDVRLDRAGSLFGTVRGPGGAVPESCELSIAVHGVVLRADYQAGSYRFASLPAGAHQLRVQGPGLGAATFAVEVHAGDDLERNLELDLGLRRRFVVEAPPGTRGDVHLALQRPGDEATWVATARLTGTDGSAPQASFVVHLAGGSYRAVAWAGARAGLAAQRDVEFRFDDEPDVTLQLQR